MIETDEIRNVRFAVEQVGYLFEFSLDHSSGVASARAMGRETAMVEIQYVPCVAESAAFFVSYPQ